MQMGLTASARLEEAAASGGAPAKTLEHSRKQVGEMETEEGTEAETETDRRTDRQAGRQREERGLRLRQKQGQTDRNWGGVWENVAKPGS